MIMVYLFKNEHLWKTMSNTQKTFSHSDNDKLTLSNSQRNDHLNGESMGDFSWQTVFPETEDSPAGAGLGTKSITDGLSAAFEEENNHQKSDLYIKVE